jgi:hypothetical protein
MSDEGVQIAPEISIAYIIEKCVTELTCHSNVMMNLRCSSVSGAVRLTRSERMMKDRALRYFMSVQIERRLTTKQRRRHMNGKNIGCGLSVSFFDEEEFRSGFVKETSYRILG